MKFMGVKKGREMLVIFTKAFWAYAFERAVKTAAQAAVGALGSTALLHEVDFTLVASAAGIAAMISVLTSLASDWETGELAREVAVQARATAKTDAINALRDASQQDEVNFEQEVYIPRHANEVDNDSDEEGA